MAQRAYRVMLARFPGGYSEHPAVSDWRIQFFKDCIDLKAAGRISDVYDWNLCDTPITMSRNRALKAAIAAEVDLCVMVDSDMGPDQENIAKTRFFPAAFDFIDQRYEQGPTIAAVPYCGMPPHENIFVFRWRSMQSTHPAMMYDHSLQQYTREEAAERGGWEPVAALPTGLCVIDMRLVTGMKSPMTGEIIKLHKPWFDYEWADDERSEKASTEDVYFTRNADIKFRMAGFPAVNHVLWDSWAIHYKLKAVHPPRLVGANDIATYFRDAVAGGKDSSARLVHMSKGKLQLPEPEHANAVPAPTNRLEANGVAGVAH